MENKDNNKPQQDRPLTIKEKAFCREYTKTGNGREAAIKAGYAPKSANVTASKLLTKSNIHDEITRIMDKKEKKAIMDAQEVMELFSAIARGEVKDQFGLDASLNDRLKAMNEIAKRTVDVENRVNGKSDAVVEIKLDWERE